MQPERQSLSGPWIAALFFLQLETRHLRLLQGGSLSLQSWPWVTCHQANNTLKTKTTAKIADLEKSLQALGSARSCPVSLSDAVAVADGIFAQAFFCQIHLTHAEKVAFYLNIMAPAKASKLNNLTWHAAAQKKVIQHGMLVCWILLDGMLDDMPCRGL